MRCTGSRALICTLFIRSLYTPGQPDQRYHQYEQNRRGQEYVIDTHRECLLTDQAIDQRQALSFTQPLGAQLLECLSEYLIATAQVLGEFCMVQRCPMLPGRGTHRGAK